MVEHCMPPVTVVLHFRRILHQNLMITQLIILVELYIRTKHHSNVKFENNCTVTFTHNEASHGGAVFAVSDIAFKEYSTVNLIIIKPQHLQELYVFLVLLLKKTPHH